MTLVDIESPEQRLERRRQQLAALQKQRKGAQQELDQLSIDFTSAVDRGDFTPDQSTERRRLLDEIADVDQASATVRQHIATAETEIAEQHARSELARIRKELPELLAAGNAQAEQIRPALDDAVRQYAAAAGALMDRLRSVESVEQNARNLAAAEEHLSAQLGEQSQAPGVPQWLEKAIRAVDVGSLEGRTLIAVRRGRRDAIRSLAELTALTSDLPRR